MSTLREGTDRQLFDTLTLRQVVTDYIVEQTKLGKKIESKLDGRICNYLETIEKDRKQ